MPELIITEKPSQCKKVAEALADTKPTRRIENKVTYYELTHKNKKIFVGCAVGHLFNLREKNKKGWTYPIYDTEWKPSYEISKSADFTKKYVEVLQDLAKKADKFTVACDYDAEGSVIGYNVVRFICKKKDGRRMKFSTLTDEELQESYKKASKHLDFPVIYSGEARHEVDWLWGINLSRALTLSIKNATDRFKILSTGRVQGPALALLATREKEIKKFKPKPFWLIEALGDLTALHKNDKFWEGPKAKRIYNKIKKEKKALVKKLSKKEFLQKPPNPFDLTALQLEAYRTMKISPKDTLTIAQQLYTKAYISYPRTSSNILPESLNYKKILKQLSKQPQYEQLCNRLLETDLKPNNGKKQDPAHPALHPTGVVPKKLSDRQAKLYDLIVRRTLATFAEPAKRQTSTIELEIKNEPFTTSGTTTLESGWHIFYGRFAKFKEVELPNLNEGDKVKIKKIELQDKETQPPKRFTPASIIKELENRNLGTKATRSSIIESLYQRNYLLENSIEVTDLGLRTVQTLEKYCHEILNEGMTNSLEENLEQIKEGKNTKTKVLEGAKKHLKKILTQFKKNETKIGKALGKATIETQERVSLVGPCNVCSKGKLRILYSRKYRSYFVACNAYPKCKTTFSLPNYAQPKTTGQECKECSYPIIKMIRKGKRPYDFCLNKGCKLKKEYLEKLEQRNKQIEAKSKKK